ncbi:hypothetical protein D3C73_1157050 [compost metagenome]
MLRFGPVCNVQHGKGAEPADTELQSQRIVRILHHLRLQQLCRTIAVLHKDRQIRQELFPLRCVRRNRTAWQRQNQLYRMILERRLDNNRTSYYSHFSCTCSRLDSCILLGLCFHRLPCILTLHRSEFELVVPIQQRQS